MGPKGRTKQNCEKSEQECLGQMGQHAENTDKMKCDKCKMPNKQEALTNDKWNVCKMPEPNWLWTVKKQTTDETNVKLWNKLQTIALAKLAVNSEMRDKQTDKTEEQMPGKNWPWSNCRQN